jgi:hypothetical protein
MPRESPEERRAERARRRETAREQGATLRLASADVRRELFWANRLRARRRRQKGGAS